MSESTVAVNILTTKKMGQFYQKVRRTQDGTTLPPLHPRPPLPPTLYSYTQDLYHLSTIIKKYGNWMLLLKKIKW
ncbi:MAG: hypothetical protein AB7V56_03645 [Candidatus Nitrosocosmicus sp.]